MVDAKRDHPFVKGGKTGTDPAGLPVILLECACNLALGRTVEVDGTHGNAEIVLCVVALVGSGTDQIEHVIIAVHAELGNKLRSPRVPQAGPSWVVALQQCIKFPAAAWQNGRFAALLVQS